MKRKLIQIYLTQSFPFITLLALRFHTSRGPAVLTINCGAFLNNFFISTFIDDRSETFWSLFQSVIVLPALNVSHVFRFIGFKLYIGFKII